MPEVLVDPTQFCLDGLPTVLVIEVTPVTPTSVTATPVTATPVTATPVTATSVVVTPIDSARFHTSMAARDRDGVNP